MTARLLEEVLSYIGPASAYNWQITKLGTSYIEEFKASLIDCPLIGCFFCLDSFIEAAGSTGNAVKMVL